MTNEDVTKAITVLERARDELVRDIGGTGAAGGVGRSQNMAPVLVNVQNALNVLQDLEEDSNGISPMAARMASLRAAKAAKNK